MTATKREPAMTAIIAYKFARAVVAGLLALTLLVLLLAGEVRHFETFVRDVHEHAASRLSLLISEWVLRALGARHVEIAIGALVLDTAVVFLEGFSLVRGWWWGPWLVAAASGGPVPFEIYAIVEHPGPIRIAVLIVNTAIVVYLLRRTWLRHRVARSLDGGAERDRVS